MGNTAAAMLSFTLMAAAPPASAPPIAQIRSALEGQWAGTLGYRDYQSNELFELPVETEIANVPDGVSQIRKSVFDEGGRRVPVWIVSITQQQGSLLTSATMRAGRPAELNSEMVEAAWYRGPYDWQLIYLQTGQDDDKPAEIRVTETLSEVGLFSTKEVRPAGQPEAAWQFRNQTRMKRVQRAGAD